MLVGTVKKIRVNKKTSHEDTKMMIAGLTLSLDRNENRIIKDNVFHQQLLLLLLLSLSNIIKQIVL